MHRNCECNGAYNYNVFVDHPSTGRNVAVLSTCNAYDASAMANFAYDAGFRVSHDIWSDVIPDAMISPEVHERHGMARFA